MKLTSEKSEYSYSVHTEDVGPPLPVRSTAGGWEFRLRTRALAAGEKMLLKGLSHIADKLHLVQHWAVELTNQHTKESFLYELHKHQEDKSNRLAVKHLEHAGDRNPDGWQQLYRFDTSKFVYGRIAPEYGPEHVRIVAMDIIRAHPYYYLLAADCIAFATTLMQQISAYKNATLTEILGLDPKDPLPTAAQVLIRISTMPYPEIYAAAVVPANPEKHVMQDTIHAALESGFRSKALVKGVDCVAKTVSKVGHKGKSAMRMLRSH